MYQRLLLPTDGSEGGDRAFVHALELAEQLDATLSILSVVDEHEFRALDGIDADTVRNDREETVTALRDRANTAGVDATTDVLQGHPVETILDHAGEVDADMIVMGTHGRTGVNRVIVGSVAEGVVRRSPIPVVTVRLTESDGPTSRSDAVDRARTALEREGQEDVELADDPHRTSGSWIVPLTSEAGVFHVHVAIGDGETRIARLD